MFFIAFVFFSMFFFVSDPWIVIKNTLQFRASKKKSYNFIISSIDFSRIQSIYSRAFFFVLVIIFPFIFNFDKFHGWLKHQLTEKLVLRHLWGRNKKKQPPMDSSNGHLPKFRFSHNNPFKRVRHNTMMKKKSRAHTQHNRNSLFCLLINQWKIHKLDFIHTWRAGICCALVDRPRSDWLIEKKQHLPPRSVKRPKTKPKKKKNKKK